MRFRLFKAIAGLSGLPAPLPRLQATICVNRG